LVHANIKRKIEPIDEVLKYLKSLKATWEKAIELKNKEEAQSPKKENSKSIDYYDTDDENDDDDEYDDDDDDDYDEDDEED